MLTTIQNSVLALLPHKRKRASSGWISFNAPCCVHQGETADTRSRGGILPSGDGAVSYHCFNCNYKVSYRPGWHLSYKFRKLLVWLGADDNTVRRLVIEAVRIKDLVKPDDDQVEKVEIEFKPRLLPDDIRPVTDDAVALKYCQERKINLDRYPLFVSGKIENNLNRRVIIPFTWQEKIIGYTSRTWDTAVKPKYYSQYEPNYVYNTDNQGKDSQFVIVTEGPFDAMSIDGVAVLSNECSEIQADIIDQLGREVIVVPDSDHAGSKLITNAIEYGWSVSFPVWLETCKDINEAVVKYGKLFVLKTILMAKETSKLKIELMRKRLYT